MAQLNTGMEMVDVDGMMVEADCLRIAEAVKAYDPNLEILCTVRADNVSEAPYVLAELCSDGQYRKIKDVWQLDERVLADIEAADCQRHDLIAVINGRNERVKRERGRRYRELMDETADVVKHIAGMKSKYTAPDPKTGEIVTFYDDRPAARGDAAKGKVQL